MKLLIFCVILIVTLGLIDIDYYELSDAAMSKVSATEAVELIKLEDLTAKLETAASEIDTNLCSRKYDCDKLLHDTVWALVALEEAKHNILIKQPYDVQDINYLLIALKEVRYGQKNQRILNSN